MNATDPSGEESITVTATVGCGIGCTSLTGDAIGAFLSSFRAVYALPAAALYLVTAQPLADGTLPPGYKLANKSSGDREAVDEAIDDIVKDGDDVSRPTAADTNIDVSGKGRSADRDLDAIAKAAGKSAESKGGGVKVVELPDGRKAVLYPASRSLGRPSMIKRYKDKVLKR